MVHLCSLPTMSNWCMSICMLIVTLCCLFSPLKYSNWCISLLSIFLMIYDWTCYIVNNILDYGSLFCFHLCFWLLWWYFVYRLTREHVCKTFRENQRHMSRNRVAFITCQVFCVRFVSFIFMIMLWLFGISCDNYVLILHYWLLFMLRISFSMWKSFYVSAIILMLLSLQTASVCYIGLCVI